MYADLEVERAQKSKAKRRHAAQVTRPSVQIMEAPSPRTRSSFPLVTSFASLLSCLVYFFLVRALLVFAPEMWSALELMHPFTAGKLCLFLLFFFYSFLCLPLSIFFSLHVVLHDRMGYPGRGVAHGCASLLNLASRFVLLVLTVCCVVVMLCSH